MVLVPAFLLAYKVHKALKEPQAPKELRALKEPQVLRVRLAHKAPKALRVILDPKVQLVLKVPLVRKEPPVPRAQRAHRVRVDHKGTQEYKVLPALRGQQVPLALKET
jgi:hypothetical protein